MAEPVIKGLSLRGKKLWAAAEVYGLAGGDEVGGNGAPGSIKDFPGHNS